MPAKDSFGRRLQLYRGRLRSKVRGYSQRLVADPLCDHFFVERLYPLCDLVLVGILAVAATYYKSDPIGNSLPYLAIT